MINPALDFRFPDDYPPASLFSFMPSVTESPFDQNHWDEVVGRTDCCVHPPAAAAFPSRGGTKARDWRYPGITLTEMETAQSDMVLLPSEPYPCTRFSIVLEILRELILPTDIEHAL